MNKKIQTSIAICTGTFFLLALSFSSCEKFYEPVQEINITEDKLFNDWYEYRSAEMGLYALQQDLVEQMFMLGELRGDLLTITDNADADMVEIYNFNISEDNRFASPTGWFKLISACNNFIRVLEREQPEVMDPESPVTNYDRLYGEALCMRAWAYFYAVRIYGKLPFIPESLVTMDEINSFISSSGTYVDSVHIDFAVDGYYNDTTYNKDIELEKKLYDTDMIIDYFTNDLETKLKAVGVNHYIDNNDATWEITIWSDWSMHALLGQMYLTRGDLFAANEHFRFIMNNSDENLRYQVTGLFRNNSWKNIFTGIETDEHIYTIWFNKSNFQQNEFSSYFEPWSPHNYMLKPTGIAVKKWESIWRYQILNEDINNPGRSTMTFPGLPGDFHRGYGVSYVYSQAGEILPANLVRGFLFLKAEGDFRTVDSYMAGSDTVVYKYSINKDVFDQDANYILYRAAGIHLYMAEIYAWWKFEQAGQVRSNTTTALRIVNDGSYYTISDNREQIGIRGRVGFGNGYDAIKAGNINYIHDPFSNEIKGYFDLSGNFLAKQRLLEEKILDERARELAWEGERFYDLMRVAKRRNDPSFLAKMVSAKYPSGQKEQIYQFLLDEKNWYLNFFE